MIDLLEAPHVAVRVTNVYQVPNGSVTRLALDSLALLLHISRLIAVK